MVRATSEAGSGEKRRIRIMIANAALYIGGAENVTATLCRGLDRGSFDVVVTHLRGCGPIAKELEAEGYNVIALPTGRTERDYATAFRLRKLVAEHDIDVLHTHDVHTLVDGALCTLSLPGLRHVTTLHHGHYPRQDRRSQLFEAMFVRAPHRVVAVGEAQRSAIARAYRLEPSRMTVIRNGVDDARARAVSTEAERIRRGAPLVIGSLSTLIEQKGLDQLLQAARLLVQRGTAFRLVIVGNGHLRQPMETLARDLGLATHVEFLGWMEDAARRVLPHIDIFVQSSLWEAMSIVVLEAMSCARPIVATTVGDNPFVLRDGESGFLVPPRSPHALADRMSQLAGDPTLRARLGAEARRDYEQRYTAARMCDDYARLYRDLAAERRGTRFWRGTSTPPPAIGDGR